ncbi:MAG TPA: translation initiation factor IF-2 [Candidatus Paceibacterota bacterium]|jgi:translation initiation factor IF-2|nr:translation initiation factor IF-2 [Candidatus Paceibacterota bacterium]
MSEDNKKQNMSARPPVVAVMGHVDHGKSTLLDYIRKTNVVESEAGGITQRISAYEVLHKNELGLERKITFLDTPGHEAFSKMRERGAMIADIAILVVSAEDGVKPQTVEAWKAIHNNKIPAIVAINKIDKPGANVEKTKTELAENEIYLENYGGKIPFVEISAKIGTGIDDLLSLILLLGEMDNLSGDPGADATGYVIETSLDSKRGIEATLIIKDGTLGKGMTVVVENSICSTRIIENFLGKMVNEATFSSPVRIFGFDTMPSVGGKFKSFKNKKDALEYAENFNSSGPDIQKQEETNKKIIPIVLKADVAGSLEAIEKEIAKIKNDGAEFKIVAKGTGPITESDIKNISSSEHAVIVGFNVKADKSALDIALKRGITISFFDIIYKMAEWLEIEMENRRPRIETVETTGRAKIIRAFSRTKERQIIGGKVTEGRMLLNGTVKIIRREFEIGRGKIVNLEKSKIKTSVIEEGLEFGMMLESKIEVVAGDIIELFSIAQK